MNKYCIESSVLHYWLPISGGFPQQNKATHMHHVICYNNYLSASAYKSIDGLWGELHKLPFSAVAYV